MKKILLLLLACSTGQTFAQTMYKYGLPKGNDFDRWSVGIIGGMASMQSDIKAKGDAQNSLNTQSPELIFGGHIGFQLTHSIGFTLRGLSGNLTQELDEKIYVRELDTAAYLNFKSPLTELTFNMQFSFGNISFVKRNTNLHFVVRAGGGLALNKPNLQYSYDKVNYKPVADYGNVSNFVMPLGAGVRYAFGKFNVGIDYDYRMMFTDRLDGLNVTNSDYDGYTSITAQVNYIIGKKKKPMEWINPMELVYNDISEVREKVDALANDKDGDGVADMFDKDSATPQGQKVYGDGSAIDTDQDGIADNLDEDPYSNRGAVVDGSGRELDADNDGVVDSKDKESNTPPGTLVNFQGVAIGNNGSKTANGSNSNTSTTTVAGYFPSIFFDMNQTAIKSIYFDRLLTVARVLKMNPDVKIRIVGSADNNGSDAINNSLGQKRADAAKAHLVTVYGIEAARISTDTKGKNEPLANKNGATDYLNRRVDFVIE
ncbi:MAG: OmpA family protein [Bacteroidia bacterium]|nr:OmpA family protein [Bacteroidia bacterium]